MEENNTPNQTPPSGGGKSSLVWVIVIIIIAVGVYAFTRGDNKEAGDGENLEPIGEEQMENNQPAGNPAPVAVPLGGETTLESKPAPTIDPGPGPTPAPGQVKVFTVDAKNFSFSPAEIRVKKGDKVKIVLNNTGGFHDWVVDEFNARTKQVTGPATAEVEFTADKAGTFEFYCSVGQHRAMGMKGNLVVE